MQYLEIQSMTREIYQLKYPNGRPIFLRLGVTSMCLGSGMGAASVIELE